MSELKGQILGIILVIVIFGIISYELKTVFTDSVAEITELLDATLEVF